MDWARHRLLYGTLDALAVLPFVAQYGDRLSPQGRRLARVLDKALRGESPLARHIHAELRAVIDAGRCDCAADVALHRENLIELLMRYGRRRRREGVLPLLRRRLATRCVHGRDLGYDFGQ